MIKKLPQTPNIPANLDRSLWEWLVKMGVAINQAIDWVNGFQSPTFTLPAHKDTHSTSGNDALSPEDIGAEPALDATAKTEIVRTAMGIVGEAPIFACRAWVNFNGAGGAIIRGSGNVSGVVRNSTGNYTVTFTTPMPHANYVPQVSIYSPGGSGTPVGGFFYSVVPSAESVRLITHDASYYIIDCAYVYVAVFC